MWSGGKDAALALDVLHSQSPRRIGALLTTIVEESRRVTMHGTPLQLVQRQADFLGLPLHVMEVPRHPSNDVYEARLEGALGPLVEKGFTSVIAGDLFLEDVREYRQQAIEATGAEALFPLWQRDTKWLAHRFIEREYKAVVSAVDTTQLNSSFVGRNYDQDFLRDLPEDVDPCGEKGAFHTFVTGGPPFENRIPVDVKGTEDRGRMHTARLDLVDPSEASGSAS